MLAACNKIISEFIVLICPSIHTVLIIFLKHLLENLKIAISLFIVQYNEHDLIEFWHKRKTYLQRHMWFKTKINQVHFFFSMVLGKKFHFFTGVTLPSNLQYQFTHWILTKSVCLLKIMLINRKHFRKLFSKFSKFFKMAGLWVVYLSAIHITIIFCGTIKRIYNLSLK